MRISVAVALFLMAWVVSADQKREVRRLPAVRLAIPPTIDGKLADGEWAGAAHSSQFTDPYTNATPADDTEIWIAFDDLAVYVAFFAHDSEPSKIVARSIQPGTVQGIRVSGGFGGGNSSVTEDVLEFSIDPFNTRSFGMSEFRVNALGTTSENISGGRSSKREFRGEWEGAASIVEGGWVAEMRIPWQIMNLPRGKGITMDINFKRGQARTQIKSEWASLTLRNLNELVGQWDGVTAPTGSNAKKVTILGYLAPEYEENSSPNFGLRGGLDVRYDFTSQLSGLVSVSPDFKNIEQQVTSIAFTRSGRFERDNRPFFTEGSRFFGGGGGGGMGDQLFYSRAITDFDQGAKVYGKLTDNTDIGLLMTGEDGDRLDGVFSLRQGMGSRSSSSLLVTSTSATGIENTVMSAGARHGVGNYSFNGEYAVSNDGGPTDTSGRFGMSYNVPKFSTSLNYRWVDPGFAPALGFVRFTDRRGISFFTNYSSEYRTSALRSFGVFLFAGAYDTYAGANQQKNLSVSANATLRSDVSFQLGLDTERFLDEEERTVSLGTNLFVSDSNRNFGVDYTFGERAGESTQFVNARGRYRLPHNIDVGLSHSFLDFQGYTDQTVFTVGWEIDARQSLAARVVRQSGDVNYYVSYSSSGFTGLDWFLIFGDPNATTWRNRVSLKFVWAR